MARKRLPYDEGTWFAVPLRNSSGYGLGLVARLDCKGGVLGYFFNTKFTTPPKLTELSDLRAEDALFVRQFGDLGLIKGFWIVLGKAENWSREWWPVPHFARIAVDRTIAWRVTYADKDGLSLLVEQEIPVWEAEVLPEDGLSGYGAIELRLTTALRSD